VSFPMSGKRKNKDLQNIYDPQGSKKRKKRGWVTNEFIFSESLKPDFFTPDSIIEFPDGDSLFKKRFVRQIEGKAKMDLSELSVDDAKEFLPLMKSFYGPPFNRNKRGQKKEKPLTPREKEFVAAARFIESETICERIIALQVGLSPKTVWNLKKRIIKRGCILPSKTKKGS